MKEFSPRGANSFFDELTLLRRKAQIKTRVAPLTVLPFTLRETRSIFKKDNCRRLQSCGLFKYKNDSFQSSNFLLLFFINVGQW